MGTSTCLKVLTIVFDSFAAWPCQELIHVPHHPLIILFHGEVNKVSVDYRQTNRIPSCNSMLKPCSVHNLTTRKQTRNNSWYRKLPIHHARAMDRIHVQRPPSWVLVILRASVTIDEHDLPHLHLQYWKPLLLGRPTFGSANRANRVWECQNGASRVHVGRCPSTVKKAYPADLLLVIRNFRSQSQLRRGVKRIHPAKQQEIRNFRIFLLSIFTSVSAYPHAHGHLENHTHGQGGLSPLSSNDSCLCLCEFTDPTSVTEPKQGSDSLVLMKVACLQKKSPQNLYNSPMPHRTRAQTSP